MKKYGYILTSELKKELAYRGNTWLSALFSVFSVMLAYLLWKAVFGETGTFNGFSLPEMTTYYLLSGTLTHFTQNDSMLNQFSNEIKSGEYSKYIIKPVSPLGYFISSSFGKALFSTLFAAIVLGGAMGLFPSFFLKITIGNVAQAIPVILLGAVLSIIVNYIIAMATFRFTDIGFLYMIQNIFKLFLSGSMIPLAMVFGNKIPMFLPFSYTLYYPILFCLGKSDISVTTAVMVLVLWVAILTVVALVLTKKAAKMFEGVGI